MWLEAKEEEELPTYLSSILTEAHVLNKKKGKMEMISPRTSFQNKNLKSPPPFDDNQ